LGPVRETATVDRRAAASFIAESRRGTASGIDTLKCSLETRLRQVSTGIRIKNADPTPTVERNPIAPQCARTRRRQIESPRPVERPLYLLARRPASIYGGKYMMALRATAHIHIP